MRAIAGSNSPSRMKSCNRIGCAGASKRSFAAHADVAEPEQIAADEVIGLEAKAARDSLRRSLAGLPWIAARLNGWNCYYKSPAPRPYATDGTGSLGRRLCPCYRAERCVNPAAAAVFGTSPSILAVISFAMASPWLFSA